VILTLREQVIFMLNFNKCQSNKCIVQREERTVGVNSRQNSSQ